MRTRLQNAAQRLFGRTTSSRNLVLTGLLALLTLGVLTLIGAILTSVVASAGGSQGLPPPSTQVGTRQPDQPGSVGVSAIPVRANAPTGGPAFTAADATQWVNTHGVFRATESGPHTVTSVEFLTQEQLDGKIIGGDGLNFPANALLCYVEVQGSFIFPSPIKGHLVTNHHIFEIFDASNGYLLDVGVLS